MQMPACINCPSLHPPRPVPGSMAAMADQVMAGFNRLLTDQQADGADARMTLVQFDDARTPRGPRRSGPHRRGGAARRHDAFEPRGTTPLLDATGRLMGRAGDRVVDRVAAGEPAEQIVVVTITDGDENASGE